MRYKHKAKTQTHTDSTRKLQHTMRKIHKCWPLAQRMKKNNRYSEQRYR